MAVATAVVFLHRFYAAKSLARNDPFVSLLTDIAVVARIASTHHVWRGGQLLAAFRWPLSRSG